MQHQPYITPFAELCSKHADLPFILGVHVWLLCAHSLQWWTRVGENLLLMKTRQGEASEAHLQRASMMYAKALGNNNPHSRAVWNLKDGR